MKNFLHKVFSLLTGNEKRDLGFLFFLIVIMAFLELTGVALIPPFIALFVKPDIASQHQHIQDVYHYFGFQQFSHFLLACGGLLIAVLWISNIFKSYTMYRLFQFTYGREYTISTRLFKNYLARPYKFFLSRNSSDLSKNILSEVGVVVNGLLVTGMQVISRLVIILFILVLLFIMDPMLVLAVGGFFGCVYAGIYFFFHARLQKIGKERHEIVEKKFNDIKEAFMNIKETRIYGSENMFLHRYAKNAEVTSRYSADRDTIAQLPAYIIEAFSFSIILIAVMYTLTEQGLSFTDVLPTLSLYAFAGYRLLPNVQMVFSGVARMRFTLPVLDTLCKELSFNAEAKSIEAPVTNSKATSLSIQNMSFRYDGAEKDTFHNLSLNIPLGKTIGIAGETGAGKTTLIDICLGLLQPQSGSVLIDNHSVDSLGWDTWRRHFSYVSQHVYLFDSSVAENIALTNDKSHIDLERVQKILELVSLTDVVNALPEGLHTKIGENGNRLSGGQRQRLSIARALYRDADIIVMDEATSALDSITERKIIDSIHSYEDKTIFMITHRMSCLNICDFILFVSRDGKVDFGTYDDVLNRNQNFNLMVNN